MGGQRLVTYTLQAESGASLRGAGWQCVADIAPKETTGWQNRPNRLSQPAVGYAKYRWEITLPIKQERAPSLLMLFRRWGDALERRNRVLR